MNRGVIIGVVAGVIIVAGGAFALLSNNDSDTGSTNNSNGSNNTDGNQQSSNNSSTPVTNTGSPIDLDISPLVGPYRITVSTVDADGRTTDATSDIDANGNIETTITDDEQVSSLIYHNGDAYVKAPTEAAYTRFPSNGSTPAVGELDVGFSQEDIDELSTFNIIDKGTDSCTNGTCQVYEYTDPDTGDTGTVKITTDSKRLSDIEVTSADGEESTIAYDYNVSFTVTPPDNFVELEFPSVEGADIPQ